MEKARLLDGLREIPLFSELSSEEMLVLSRCCAQTLLPKGTIIFRENDDYYGFYVVMQGSVKVYKLSPDGKETILHIIRPFNTLAEIPMFLGEGYPAYAETIEESLLICVYKDGFLDLLRTHPDLAFKMLAGLSRRLKSLGSQMEKLTTADVKTRVAQFILGEFDKNRSMLTRPSIQLSIPKSLLAANLGTIQETLSRAFKKLEVEGLIEVVGKEIRIRDLTALKREYGKRD
jgi:CRP/FNR family transcriptional regulator, dissimilatory nitrate respiration regulator